MKIAPCMLAMSAAIALLPLAGCGSRSSESANSTSPEMDTTTTDGRHLYAMYCAACHGAEGQGVPGSHPPLARSEWVKAPAKRLAAVTLDGLAGPLVVDGQTYRGIMPAWRTVLTDGQIASVLTYVRQSWGNDAPAISSTDVGEIRIRDQNRNAFWTPQELDGIK